MNSSSFLKRNSNIIGTFYDMPLLEVISNQPEKCEYVNEMIVNNYQANEVESISDAYETKVSGIMSKAQSDAFQILADAQKKADDIVAEAKINSQK
ncbi:MAG: hypothetical protein PHV07_01190 [Oscillospiraceae bacterium]|nr:hypothetical protein [Oscillospiraceae bacterium]